MPTDDYRKNAAAVRAALAADLGCEPEAFDSHQLTIGTLDRPAESEVVAHMVTCGTGTVIGVKPQLMDYVTANAPEPHFRIFRPDFRAALATHARAEGWATANAGNVALGFVPEVIPSPPAMPPGSRIEQLGQREWLPLRDTKEFPNALGDLARPALLHMLSTVFALIDDDGRVAAIAGVWDERRGRYEIGLDVRRDARGHGFAKHAVIAAMRWSSGEGRVPVYTCAATNVRSHATALSCGLRPLWTASAIYAPPPTA